MGEQTHKSRVETTEPGAPLLSVVDLSISFSTGEKSVEVVDKVSFDVQRARTVAIVGESGCGKTVTALSLMRLIPQPPGRITAGQMRLAIPGQTPMELTRVSDRQMRAIRGRRLAMVFQDPMAAFNPVLTIGRQIVEAIQLHTAQRGPAARSTAVDALRRVEMPQPDACLGSYPHQLSGGMLQRAMIAMALACNPSLLIADEPTTALDVTTQVKLLELLRSIQQRASLSILLITHNLGVVAQLADYVYVMYAGRVVEHAPTAALLSSPLHPYTTALLRCTPGAAGGQRLPAIPGRVPPPADRPPGCAFHPRCSLSAQRATESERRTLRGHAASGIEVLQRCVEDTPAEPSGIPSLREVQPDRYVACWEIG